MFSVIKKQIKKLVPESFIIFWHRCNALLAAFWYGNPSQKLIVIGITGTKGKTSTSEFTWSVLTYGGHFKTGLIGTAHTYIGETEMENSMHMTMPSPWYTQKILRQMVKNGCTHVVLEVSSEGLKQERHRGINYDIGVFTNLSPEHLPSHGNSFDKYREAKGKLFAHISHSQPKRIFPKKVSIVNADDEHASYFQSFVIPQKISYSLNDLSKKGLVDREKNSFIYDDQIITVHLPGIFNIQNALASYQIGIACGIEKTHIKEGIEKLSYIPGRMEKVDVGQDFQVFIDYAHEKLSMQNLLTTLIELKKENEKIILLFGAEGGGRDKRKRKEMGTLAKEMADSIILTNVDPYDDNPKEIIDDIAQYIVSEQKHIGENLFLIEDRSEAIKKAFQLAGKNDIVCICGKGAEKTMVIGSKTIPWDEQKIVRVLLKEHIQK